MIKIPCFKDTYYIFSGYTDARFRIMSDNDVIYEGRAKARPNSLYSEININKILMNFLSNTLENQLLTGNTFTITHSDAYKEFSLYVYNPQQDSWILCESYGLLFNFSYEDIDLSTQQILSDRVNSHISNGMLLPTTTYFSNGVVSTLFLRYAGSSEYCGRWSLLYRNLKGGWDSLLFEGKCRKSDDYDKAKMRKSFNNNRNEFGNITYYNGITSKWELNTGYLSNMEAENIAKNLVSSNECYLQDLVEGTIIPVVITDNSVKYKEYLLDDENPINYMITVESSQERINL